MVDSGVGGGVGVAGGAVDVVESAGVGAGVVTAAGVAGSGVLPPQAVRPRVPKARRAARLMRGVLAGGMSVRASSGPWQNGQAVSVART